MNKKALSTVVATVIIILLTVAAIAIVWTFVRNMINENKNQVESCFEVESSEKVSLNGLYTCYSNTTTDPGLERVQFSLNIADVEVEAVLISIMAGGESRTITLTSEGTDNDDIKYLNDPETEDEQGWWKTEKLPKENAGQTYIVRYDTDATKVDSIRIAPVINGEQCGVTDQINDVADCTLLTG